MSTILRFSENIINGIIAGLVAAITQVTLTFLLLKENSSLPISQETLFGASIAVIPVTIVAGLLTWLVAKRVESSITVSTNNDTETEVGHWNDDVLEAILDENFEEFQANELDPEDFAEMYPEKKEKIEWIRENRSKGTN